MAAPKTSHLCSTYVDSIKHIFSHLEVPIADDKLQGPTTRITYLGIEIDSNDMVTRLPVLFRH